MRDQFLLDPIDHLDFHHRLGVECANLEKMITSGSYMPGQSRRILIEKSKGLCRQLVIPNVRDAIILQSLSDGLYADIRGRAPTSNSFFEPQDHTFSASNKLINEPEYGSFKAWLNFQKEIFRFSKNRQYMIVTDIANFYDSISYTHLRNVISDLIDVREPVLDMLIFVLSGLLWQPDYMPRIEVGLPQINLDAPRILAHCFLYELDEYLQSIAPGDFVRFMDDIDVGVDTIQRAKEILKCIDLVLQTRHVRLNSGKTLILRSSEAREHFRVRENFLLDMAVKRINTKVAAGISVARERESLVNAIRTMHRRKRFDTGNGEKILKRMFNISARIGADVDQKILLDTLIRRPGSRGSALNLISRLPLTRARTSTVRKFVQSGMIVDDGSFIDTANYLVDSLAPNKRAVDQNLADIRDDFPTESLFSLYGRIWLTSKYGSPDELLNLLITCQPSWSSDTWLGRLVGGLYPLFLRHADEPRFRSIVVGSGNPDAYDVYQFHDELHHDPKRFEMTYDYLRAINISKRTGISHPRFLLILSALSNSKINVKKKEKLKQTHSLAWSDAYYRSTARRCLGITFPVTPFSIPPVP